MTFQLPGEAFPPPKPKWPVFNAHLPAKALNLLAVPCRAGPAPHFAPSRAFCQCRGRSAVSGSLPGAQRAAARSPLTLPCAVTGSSAAPDRLCCISAGCSSSLLFTVPRRCPDPAVLTPAPLRAPQPPPALQRHRHRAPTAPPPLTFNSRVPGHGAALPGHRAARQAPAWLCRGAWCWPGTARGAAACRCTCFASLKLLTSFCLAWQAPGPSLPLFTASFTK